MLRAAARINQNSQIAGVIALYERVKKLDALLDKDMPFEVKQFLRDIEEFHLTLRE